MVQHIELNSDIIDNASSSTQKALLLLATMKFHSDLDIWYKELRNILVTTLRRDGCFSGKNVERKKHNHKGPRDTFLWILLVSWFTTRGRIPRASFALREDLNFLSCQSTRTITSSLFSALRSWSKRRKTTKRTYIHATKYERLNLHLSITFLVTELARLLIWYNSSLEIATIQIQGCYEI